MFSSLFQEYCNTRQHQKERDKKEAAERQKLRTQNSEIEGRARLQYLQGTQERLFGAAYSHYLKHSIAHPTHPSQAEKAKCSELADRAVHRDPQFAASYKDASEHVKDLVDAFKPVRK